MTRHEPRTIFDKVWSEHVVSGETAETPAVLYIDLHLIHEVTTPQAFSVLRERKLKVRRPDLTLGTLDHSTPTTPFRSLLDLQSAGTSAAKQVTTMQDNCREFGLELFAMDSPHRGIVHVIGPELGATQPGKTIVCGDSHTSTHGAFGALAFGIGTTEVGHVLALYNRGGTVRDVTKRRGAADAQIQLPDERAGLAFVFRVFDRISYALVMQVTRPVSPLDVVQTP